MLKPSSGQRPVLVFVGTTALAAVVLFALFAPLSGAWSDVPLLLIVLGALVSGTLGVVTDRRTRREPPRPAAPPSKAHPILSLFNKFLISFFATASVQTMIAGAGGLIARGVLVLTMAGLMWQLERTQQRLRTLSVAPEATPQLRARLRWVEVAGGALLVLQLGGLLVSNAYDFAPCGWADLTRRLQGCQGALHHPDSVTSLSYTADGRMLATASSDNQIRLWSLPDRRLLHTLQGHTDWVNHVAVTPDGQTLASASADKTVRLWRVSDGALLQTLSLQGEDARGLAFTPDSRALAIAAALNSVQLWRVADGALLQTIKATNGGDNLSFTPDGATLVMAGYGDTIQVWDVARGALVREIVSTASMREIALSPDGTLVAAGDRNGQLALWRLSDGALVRRWPGHTGNVACVAFSPDGTALASAGDDDDETVRVWRVADGAQLWTTKLKLTPRSLAVAPDNRTLAVSSYDDVLLWRYR